MYVLGVILARIFPAYSSIRTKHGQIIRIFPYSVRMEKADQNNSEHLHFLRSDIFL